MSDARDDETQIRNDAGVCVLQRTARDGIGVALVRSDTVIDAMTLLALLRIQPDHCGPCLGKARR
jgi:hypothetical protein